MSERLIDAIVDSAIRIKRKDLSDRLFERLNQAFAVENPQYAFKRRLRQNVYGIPHKLYPVEEAGEYVRIPRGGMEIITDVLGREGVKLKFEDRRCLPEAKLNARVRPGIGYLYQRDAAERLAMAGQGYIVFPCGGGKTFAGVMAIGRVNTPTLVLVPTRDLVTQWVSEISSILEGVDVGPIEKGIKPVTVATVGTFAEWPADKAEAFFGQFGNMVMDEVHHVPAYSYRRILGRSPAKFRLGLTATPDREDGLGPLIPMFCGRLLLQKTHQELVALGVLVIPSVKVVETKFTYPYKGHYDWAPMQDAIIRDADRNALIVGLVEREVKAGCVTLVLCSRKEHCEMLGSMLNERGVGASVLTGSKTKKQRKNTIAIARLGWEQGRCIIATSLADEGLDLPILARVFLVAPGRAKARTTQRLGRLMRPHPDVPDKVLFDLADVRVPHLRRHLYERRKLYREILGADQGELFLDDEAASIAIEDGPDDSESEIA